jgi:hypothetical protein
MLLRGLAIKVKDLTSKSYRFGKEIHKTAKEEIARAKRNIEQERIRKQKLELQILRSRKKELERLIKIRALKEELGINKKKSDFFNIKF